MEYIVIGYLGDYLGPTSHGCFFNLTMDYNDC
jgi:hypothetical protein